MSRVPPLLKIDPEWPATADSPNWVAICAAEWDADNYFHLSGHIGVERGQYCVDAINQYAALQKRCEQLEEALRQGSLQLEMAADCIENRRYDEALLHCRSLVRLREAALSKGRV